MKKKRIYDLKNAKKKRHYHQCGGRRIQYGRLLLWYTTRGGVWFIIDINIIIIVQTLLNRYHNNTISSNRDTSIWMDSPLTNDWINRFLLFSINFVHRFRLCVFLNKNKYIVVFFSFCGLLFSDIFRRTFGAKPNQPLLCYVARERSLKLNII